MLEEIEGAVSTAVKGKIDEAQSKNNQGPWLRKNTVSLRFYHGTEMTMMIETLGEERADRQELLSQR